MKKNYELTLKSLLVSLLGVAASAFAQNATTPATVNLLSTFESISVRAKFQGDANQNNSATLQFRKLGTTDWRNAYPPIIDRRTTIGAHDNSEFVNEARGSIVGLVPNTSYEVKLTWTDSDGLAGAATRTNTVSTLTYTPPTGGKVIYVDAAAALDGDGSVLNPCKTIPTALRQVLPGDTIRLRNGSYLSFSLTTSGDANHYCTIEPDGAARPYILGDTENCILLDANYWRIRGLHFAQSPRQAIYIQNYRHHLYIEDCLMTNVAAASIWPSGGIRFNFGSSNVFVLRNTIRTTNQSPDNVFGIFIRGLTNRTIVIASNLITGTFWDGIGNGGNSFYTGFHENCDVVGNTITGYMDDPLEIEGENINDRVWGNFCSTGVGNTALGAAGTITGPTYIFRNVVLNSKNMGIGVKLGNNGVGFTFFFHNTIVTSGGGGACEAVGDDGGPPYSQRHVWRNNIIQASGNIYWQQSSDNSYDYTCCYQTAGGFAGGWNRSANYATFAEFRAGTGQDAHSIYANPRFVDNARRLAADSPAINRGLVLPNFNDGDSAWPFASLGPDLGAWELMGTLPPQPPEDFSFSK